MNINLRLKWDLETYNTTSVELGASLLLWKWMQTDSSLTICLKKKSQEIWLFCLRLISQQTYFANIQMLVGKYRENCKLLYKELSCKIIGNYLSVTLFPKPAVHFSEYLSAVAF